MRQSGNAGMNNFANGQCSERHPLLMLFAAGDELDPVQQSELSSHLAQCSDCSATLDQERSLLALLGEHRVEPDATLLASCRAGLEDALDREEEGGWLRRKVGALLPSGWLSPQPAWSAALLVMIGVSAGMLGPRLLRHPVAPASSASAVHGSSSDDSIASDPAIPSSPTALGRLDLHTADVAGINVFPAYGNDPPQVELQMMAQEPVTVQGTVNDDDVKRVLLYVLRNNKRFDPDVRLNAVDLLQGRKDDPEVRSALCQAVRTDKNAAVRLKALEALNGAEPQEIIRNTLLDALLDDQNPGVRVEAINSLRERAEKGEIVSDDRVLSVLRDRMQHDSNTYIRLQSAAAIRDLGPAEK
jgi:HEAT repeats